MQSVRISSKASVIIFVSLCALISKIEAQLQQQQQQVDPTGTTGANSGGTSSFLLDQARALLESSSQITPQQQQDMFSAFIPNTDPKTTKLLRDNINKVTELINNYRQNGLSNMPNLPNLPGLNSVVRVPDKLLRAELSMLQDEIRMAQDMMQNPITATMNAPRDLATMLQRMAQQLEQ